MHVVTLLGLVCACLCGGYPNVHRPSQGDTPNAPRHELVILRPGTNDGETAFAREAVERLGAMFDELGLAADSVADSMIARGGLDGRKVAVFPCNAKLPPGSAKPLRQFVEKGGKVLVCYYLPAPLGSLLGFSPGKWIKQDRAGQFAEMRFEASDVRGLPASVRQASWNITTAEPVGFGARPIGRWVDDRGADTGQAAVWLSKRGALVGHVILGDDREGKKRLLAALLGHLAPSLWKPMAKAKREQCQSVGHCRTLEALSAYVDSRRVSESKRLLEDARQTLARADKRFQERDYVEAVRLADEARAGEVRAYLLAQPSRTPEGRAVWNLSGTGAYPGDWDRTAKELADAGFNMILPNMLCGTAHYPSDILPRSRTFQRYGDQMAQCLAAAKRYGLEVHVWNVTYRLSEAPKQFVEQMEREGRLQMSATGQSHPWLCPSRAENIQLEVDSLRELVQKYNVDGVHLDFIRYPVGDYCYCDGCRKQFEADTRKKVEHWPSDCRSGTRQAEYRQWRCDRITRLVAAVHRECKRIRPGLKISAAVFGAYPACRESVGQDWVAWADAGYVDFLCPMDYFESDATFRSLLEKQLRLVSGKVPLYPGVGAASSDSTLSADRVVGQIHEARSLGAAGFAIFNLTGDTAATILPAVGLGVGARKALPPHAHP